VKELAAVRDLPTLLALLGRRNQEVREEAFAALQGLASADPDPFIALLSTGGDPELAAMSAAVLATVPGLDPSRLIGALGEPGFGASPHAVRLLAEQRERGLPDLLGALESGNEQKRDGAVLALTAMGGVAWPSLSSRLKNPSHRVRRGAARALSQSGWIPEDDHEACALLAALGDWGALAGEGPVGFQSLVDALADAHPGDRGGAARALGGTGRTDAAGPLLDRLSRDPEEEVRGAAADALGRLADPRAVPHLVRTLHDPSPRVRQTAARALTALGWRPSTEEETVAHLVASGDWAALARLGGVAVPGLVAVIGDDSFAVRRGASRALLEIGQAARAPLEEARRDPNPAVQEEAAAILARLPAGQDGAAPEPGTIPPPPLAALVGALYAGDAGERVAAAGALASMPPDRAVPALAGALLDPDPDLRRAAVASLGELATPGAMPLVVDRLADPDAGVRGAALEALSAAGPRAVPALVAALGKPEREVRLASAGLLVRSARQGHQAGDPVALSLALEDWHGLARFGEDAIEPLTGLLAHPDPDLRLGAVVALGGIGGARAEDLIRLALADPSPAVRNRAASLFHLDRPGLRD